MAEIYDNSNFFKAYSQMDRSRKGLKAAGEWHELKTILPNFKNKRVLDLGCGYGWHCRYAAEKGAKEVIGIDASVKMIGQAKKMTDSDVIEYQVLNMMDIGELNGQFDVIISSLAIHYIKDYSKLVKLVNNKLNDNGSFIMSVEHPVFTAQGKEEWVKDQNGKNLYWPVDRYFDESKRQTDFLGYGIKKYHRTIMTYVNTLIDHGFMIDRIIEPTPTEEMIKTVPGMKDEIRRPMMLIIAATKK